jgi:hypothetical protein
VQSADCRSVAILRRYEFSCDFERKMWAATAVTPMASPMVLTGAQTFGSHLPLSWRGHTVKNMTVPKPTRRASHHIVAIPASPTTVSKKKWFWVGARKWTPLWSPDTSGGCRFLFKGMEELLQFKKSGGEGGIRIRRET